jgi:hypothetical protein
VTPAAIRARLASLREAGAKLRRRPARETLAALARVFDGWSDPSSAWRLALESELPGATGFSPQMVREGLARGLDGWSGDALRELVAREIGPPERLDSAGPGMAVGFDVTAVLLAGSIPMPSLVSLLTPLALRSPVLAKSASRDSVTPRLLARSLAETDAELAQCLEIIDVPGVDAERIGALLEADCVVATGSDETISAVRSRVQPDRRVVVRGHRLSLAALGVAASDGAALEDVAGRLALDVALWDQLGCLSPIAVYVVGEDAADRVAAALARALAAAERRWPRGDVGATAAAVIAHERADAELRRAAGRRVALHASEGSLWTVLREDGSEPRPAPLHRFVRVLPVRDAAAIPAALAPLAAHLAGVAIEGFGPHTRSLARELADLGASRICAPGRLQAPPLAWSHGGEGVLIPIARFTDLEVPM